LADDVISLYFVTFKNNGLQRKYSFISYHNSMPVQHTSNNRVTVSLVTHNSTSRLDIVSTGYTKE